jgi:hypothetical protein
MASLERALADLRIFGDDLIPKEVTKLLGAEPTLAHFKGERVMLGTPSRMVVRRTGAWHLEAQATEPEDFDSQVVELLTQLTSDLDIWSDLTRRFRVDLFCGWFMGGNNEGVQISPLTMMALGERGIRLSLDIYGPDRVEDVDE